MYLAFQLSLDHKIDDWRFLHFTSIKAMMSIINSLSFRLYSPQTSNDPDEVSYLFRTLGLNIPVDIEKQGTYTLSMCSSSVLNSDNILNLWRLYGQNGFGAAIEFDIEDMVSNSAEDLVYPAKICYDLGSVQKMSDAFQKFNRKHPDKISIDGLWKRLAPLYKNKYFKVEEEVRLIHPGKIASEVYLDHEDYFFDISNRNVGTYYSIDLTEKSRFYSFPNISRIILGFQNDDNFRKEMELLIGTRLRKAGFESPKVELSQLKDVFR
jgi:hypothetical protein